MDWIFVGVWVAMLLVLYLMSEFLEKKAAMRGTNRSPLPGFVDKGVRIFFLFVLTSPLWYPFPWYVLPLVVLYLPSYIDGSEKSGKRVSAWVQRWSLWRFVQRYFSLSMVATAGKLDPSKQYVIGCHPHGFIPVATMVALLTKVCNATDVLGGIKLRTLAASFCFYVPAYRDLLLAGGVIDAARYNARQALDDGYSIALVPGGATEALYAGKEVLVLKHRLGFVRLAMETGADLVPVYSFGETRCYDQLSTVLPFVKPVQVKFQKIFGLSLPLVTNIIPKRVKVTLVVGKPIPVTKNHSPSYHEVKALLEVYVKAVHDLFDAHAATYIEKPEERKLEIH